MRKFSDRFYSDLVEWYVLGSFVQHPDGGFHFNGDLKREAISNYWNEIGEHYPEFDDSNPRVTLTITELKEFCEKLPLIAASPLMKALS